MEAAPEIEPVSKIEVQNGSGHYSAAENNVPDTPDIKQRSPENKMLPDKRPESKTEVKTKTKGSGTREKTAIQPSQAKKQTILQKPLLNVGHDVNSDVKIKKADSPIKEKPANRQDMSGSTKVGTVREKQVGDVSYNVKKELPENNVEHTWQGGSLSVPQKASIKVLNKGDIKTKEAVIGDMPIDQKPYTALKQPTGFVAASGGRQVTGTGIKTGEAYQTAAIKNENDPQTKAVTKLGQAQGRKLAEKRLKARRQANQILAAPSRDNSNITVPDIPAAAEELPFITGQNVGEANELAVYNKNILSVIKSTDYSEPHINACQQIGTANIKTREYLKQRECAVNSVREKGSARPELFGKAVFHDVRSAGNKAKNRPVRGGLAGIKEKSAAGKTTVGGARSRGGNFL